MENVLIKRRKHITHQRYLAFLKRLMILSMQLLHNGALGCLSVIKTSLQLNNQLDILLDTEAHVGSGRYDPNIEEPEYSNANCTNLFELVLMSRHYHPTVKKYINHIASGVPVSGNGVLPSDLAKLTPNNLYDQFDSSSVAFNPAIPPPNKKHQASAVKSNRRHTFVSDDLKKLCKRKWNDLNAGSGQIKNELNFYLHFEHNYQEMCNNKNNNKKRKVIK